MTFSLIRIINIYGIHTKQRRFVVLPLVPQIISRVFDILDIHTKQCSFVVLPMVPQIISRVHSINRCSFIVCPLVPDDLFPFIECLYRGHTQKNSVVL